MALLQRSDAAIDRVQAKKPVTCPCNVMEPRRFRTWAVCRQWCKPDATFAAQAEPLAEVRTLQQYADWMAALLGFIPDGRYELKSFAVDEDRRNVCAYAVFSGTHTGTGGPCAPTGRSVASDYVYVMFFDGDKIQHMQKIWHAGLAMQQLGWV